MWSKKQEWSKLKMPIFRGFPVEIFLKYVNFQTLDSGGGGLWSAILPKS
ncbi:hypothetical protein STRDD12_00646 [Streptococcus sp. DD12]|nr:hypothetical protein STRDD12_00646 [Streptococcus sp. DD12]